VDGLFKENAALPLNALAKKMREFGASHQVSDKIENFLDQLGVN
jgi:hypothetical protein